MRLFATQGYSTTSLAQVAKEAEVSKALIFWHFQNKEALFRDAVQRTLEPYLINVLDDLEGLAEDDQLRRLIEEYYAFVAKHPDSVKLVLGVLRHRARVDWTLAGALRHPLPHLTPRIRAILRAGVYQLLFLPRIPMTRSQFWQILGVGVIGYGISLGFQFVGTKLSTASNGALVTSATPAFILLFAPWLLGEKVTGRKLVALFISTLGVAAVIDPRSAELSPSLFWGNLSLLAAAVTWALYSVLVRKVTQGVSVVTSTAIMLAGGLPSGLVLGAWELQTQGMGAITPGVIGGLLFLGVISTAGAMFLWNYAFAELPAGVASLTFFAQPLVGTLLGALLLHEKISPLFILGGILIGIGLIIASRASVSETSAIASKGPAAQD